MSKTQVIRRGESLPFEFDRDGKSIEGYVCTISVKQFPSDIPAVTRVITPTNNAWSGFLTHTETNQLVPGLWHINARLVKSETDEEEAEPVRFSVTQSWDTDDPIFDPTCFITVIDSDDVEHVVPSVVL